MGPWPLPGSGFGNTLFPKHWGLFCVVWGPPQETDTGWLSLFPLIRNSPGLKNGGHSLKILWGESNKSQPPGKRFQRRHKRVLKAGEEKLRKEFLWEIRPFKSTYVHWRTEKAKRGPGQDACSEKSWERHLWLTSMPTSNRKWRLRQIYKQNGQILKDCPSTELTCEDWKFFCCFSPSLSAFPFLLTPATQGNLLSKHQFEHKRGEQWRQRLQLTARSSNTEMGKESEMESYYIGYPKHNFPTKNYEAWKDNKRMTQSQKKGTETPWGNIDIELTRQRLYINFLKYTQRIKGNQMKSKKKSGQMYEKTEKIDIEIGIRKGN